jgi:hypothetical protein
MPSAATAQDILEFKTDPTNTGGICCWSFVVKNRSSQAINKVELTFTDINPIAFAGFSTPENWEGSQDDAYKVMTYVPTPGVGSPIQPNSDRTGFSFCHDGIDSIDKPVRISWKTYNNQTVLSQGSALFICTGYQTYTMLDSVRVTSTKVGTDPIYNFTVTNRNQPLASSIGGMVFELQTTTAGTIRPKSIVAPTGWMLDSVTPYRAYFSTENSLIGPNQSLSGFQVGLRSNSTVKNVTWVWRARDGEGSPIDRDTLRNIANNAENGDPSCDELTMTKVNGCLYNFSVSNFHATNTAPPSRITSVRIISRTPGVTFATAPTKPANWGASIKTGTKDTIVYAAQNESFGIPSGITFNDFAFSVDNPTGEAYQIEWQTLRGTTVLCSATVNQQCAVEAPRQDESAIELQQDQNCAYRMTITNSHNTPPSALRAISVEIPQGAGTLEPQGSDLGWESAAGQGNRSFVFRAVEGSSNPLASGAGTSITFRVIPTNPDQPVTLTWKTYENAGGAVISQGTHQVSCAPIPQDCEVVEVSSQNSSDSCYQRFNITNQVAGDVSVNSVTITSKTPGVTIGTAHNVVPWQKTITQDNSGVTYTGSLPTGLAQGFNITFASDVTGERTFSVEITTKNTNNRTCTETRSVTCNFQPLQSVDGGLQSKMKVNVSPNPTQGKMIVRYSLPEQGRASISIIDVLGTTHQSVFSGPIGAGDHELMLDASTLPNGTYYVRVETGYGIVTRQLVVNR